MTVLCTLFTYRSFFSPGTWFGPMIPTFRPVGTFPEKIRPKTKNLLLSEAGAFGVTIPDSIGVSIIMRSLSRAFYDKSIKTPKDIIDSTN
jgi:hypothetical protein